MKKLSGNELRYGAGATPAAGVVYQPDVVVIGGGAGAVHAASAAGLTWTIDANAPGANELAVGKIMLATSFGTGRVLRLTKSGGEDVVVLGPVAITDVIRDADLGSAAPIPIGETLAYTTPTAPGISVDAPQDPSATSGPPGPASPGTGQPANTSSPTGTAGTRSHYQRRLTHAGGGNALVAPAAIRALAAPAAPTLPPPTTAPTTVAAGDFQVTPICCDELGINIGYHKGDGELTATVKLVGKSSVGFRLVISGGVLREATVRVHGASTLSVAIHAVTLSSAGSFAGKTIEIPETLTIPLAVFGIPLVLSLNQSFYLSMQLLGAATFETNGAYGVSGDLGFGYRDGGPTLYATAMAIKDPMTANTTAVGIASGAIRLRWNLKASIGIGVLGFGAGVWYQLGVELGIVGNSKVSTLMPGCVIDTVVADGRYGIGWWISPVVTEVINFFLNLVRVKPIAASGGALWGPKDLWRPTPGNYCP